MEACFQSDEEIPSELRKLAERQKPKRCICGGTSFSLFRDFDRDVGGLEYDRQLYWMCEECSQKFIVFDEVQEVLKEVQRFIDMVV
jgi:hypothetical protein